MPEITAWSVADGSSNVAAYMFLVLAGGNFVFELLVNIVLSPVVLRILNYKKKMEFFILVAYKHHGK